MAGWQERDQHDGISHYPSALLPEVTLWCSAVAQEAIAARRPGSSRCEVARAFLRCPRGGSLEAILLLLGVDPDGWRGTSLRRLEAIWSAADALGPRVQTPEQLAVRREAAALSLQTRRAREALEPQVERIKAPRDVYPHPVPDTPKPPKADRTKRPRLTNVEQLMRRLSV